MLETYRFVAILATMQPPYQLLPEDSSPEKVVTIFKLRIYFTQPMLRMCMSINAHLHAPSQPTGLLEKRITFHSFLYLQLRHYLISSLVFLILPVTSHLRHRQ